MPIVSFTPEQIEKARVLGEQLINHQVDLSDLEAHCTPDEMRNINSYVESELFESRYQPVLKAVCGDFVLEFLEPQKVLDFYRCCCVMMSVAKTKINEYRKQRGKASKAEAKSGEIIPVPVIGRR